MKNNNQCFGAKWGYTNALPTHHAYLLSVFLRDTQRLPHLARNNLKDKCSLRRALLITEQVCIPHGSEDKCGDKNTNPLLKIGES